MECINVSSNGYHILYRFFRVSIGVPFRRSCSILSPGLCLLLSKFAPRAAYPSRDHDFTFSGYFSVQFDERQRHISSVTVHYLARNEGRCTGKMVRLSLSGLDPAAWVVEQLKKEVVQSLAYSFHTTLLSSLFTSLTSRPTLPPSLSRSLRLSSLTNNHIKCILDSCVSSFTRFSSCCGIRIE